MKVSINVGSVIPVKAGIQNLKDLDSGLRRNDGTQAIFMNIDRARELLQVQTGLGSGYNRNSARLILAEVQRAHGQAAVDRLIRELDLEAAFGFKPGTEFKAP